MTLNPDLQIEGYRSIVLVRPLSDVGREWLREYVADTGTWFGGALAVKPRYITALREDAASAGLEEVAA